MGYQESDNDCMARTYIAVLVVLLCVMFFVIRSRDLDEKGDINRRLTALEAAQKGEQK